MQTYSVLDCIWKLQFQIFQIPLDDVSKTLIVWRHHKDVLETFKWKILKTLCRRLQILWLEVEIKTFWRRWVFNLENTFWTSIKHFYLSHLKALWRRFEGSISKNFKHIVQTSSGRITWGRGEDILQTVFFFNLKNDLWTCSKISTWAHWRRYGGVLKVVFPNGYKTSFKRLHILWLEIKIQTFWRRWFFKSYKYAF